MNIGKYLIRAVTFISFLFLSYASLEAYQNGENIVKRHKSSVKGKFRKNSTKLMIGCLGIVGVVAIILSRSIRSNYQHNQTPSSIEPNKVADDYKSRVNRKFDYPKSIGKDISKQKKSIQDDDDIQILNGQEEGQKKREQFPLETKNVPSHESDDSNINKQDNHQSDDSNTNKQDNHQSDDYNSNKEDQHQVDEAQYPEKKKEKTAIAPNSSSGNISSIWKEKEYLFSIPVVNNMTIDLRNNIMKFIEEGKTEAIQKLIYRHLGDKKEVRRKKLKELNRKIKEDQYCNLATLCSEVILHKPEQDNSLLNYWITEKQEKWYFTNKTLQFSLDNMLNMDKPIKKFDFIDNEKDKVRMFLIDDFNTCVAVVKKEKNQYQININQEKEEGFFEVLLRMNQDSKMKKVSMIKQSIISCSLHTGEYSVIYLQEASKGESAYDELLKSFDSTESVNNLMGIDGLFPKHDTLKIIELKGCKEEKDLFRIGIFIKKSNASIVGIFIRKNNKKLEYWNQTVFVNDILTCYKVKVLKKETKLLSAEVFKNSFKVISQVDSNTIDIQNRKKINRLEKELLDSLLNKENYSNYLIDILIKKGNISLEDIQKSQIVFLGKRVEDIVHLYDDSLSQKVTEESILSRLVEQTLISMITKKPSYSKKESLFELLNGAYKHIKKVKNKPIFMLLGNTGSGKSTTASYLMGEELIFFSNKVGEKVIKKKKEKKGSPVIGQKIGSSDTLYTRGFKVRKKYREKFPTLIVDSPGFGVTRSKENMICTNLSLDEAVLQSGPIKGLVLVIPIDSFLIGRGNHAFQFMQLMQEKFPGIFRVDSPDFKYVHILVTKHTQSDRDVVDAFRKGGRFTKVLIELDEQETKVINDKNKSAHEQQKMLSAIQEKKEIWHLMKILQEEKRFDLIHLKNTMHRERLLAKYGKVDGEIKKVHYQTALQSYQIDEISILLKKLFFTWQDIFQEYNALVDQVKDLIQQEKIANSEGNKAKIDLESMKQAVKELETLQNKKKERIKEINSAIHKKEKEIEVLSDGTQEKTLWEFKHTKGDRLDINKDKSSGVLVDSYVGDLYADVVIDKEYRIQGITKEESNKINIGDNISSSYMREATFTSTKCDVDTKAHYKGSNVVMFGIKKKYDGKEPFPSAKLTFLVQNIDHYAAEIEQRKSGIIKLVRERDRITQDLSELIVPLEQKRNILNEASKKEVKESTDDVDQGIKIETLGKNIKEGDLSQVHSILEETKQKKRRYAFIMMKKYNEPIFLISLANSLFDHPKWKKESKVDKHMIESLEVVTQKFLQYYNDHSDRLYSECEKDLEETNILKIIKSIKQKSTSLDHDDESDSSESDDQKNDKTLESFLKKNGLGNIFHELNSVGSFANQLTSFLELTQGELVQLCGLLKISDKEKSALKEVYNNAK